MPWFIFIHSFFSVCLHPKVYDRALNFEEFIARRWIEDGFFSATNPNDAFFDTCKILAVINHHRRFDSSYWRIAKTKIFNFSYFWITLTWSCLNLCNLYYHDLIMFVNKKNMKLLYKSSFLQKDIFKIWGN